ncbi:type VI secretion system accessory protein TagJ [Nitrospirillum viridazoti]|uniref:SciE type virulence protein n=1 Tax=Nitrospirillum viridazoti CBAmc TaxID=1441467 RepID=A0A248K353_9PROT|nr:type VI secretion system accessory protein TagJ [Nitrospirillum amazonense]ASG25151.1 SciE type virulence protein [Nitrospirillum amazonense CBAmc]TWB28262.1 type VI secretion system protein ImpE [Nitrospirillum amazonense]
MSQTAITNALEAGDLFGALSAATAHVQKAPTDTGARYLLAEILCVAGQLERADNQLSVVLNQDPGSMVPVSLLRQLIRAETARQDWYREGRPPEFLTDITAAARLHLEAGVKARAGDGQGAAATLAEAETLRRATTGQHKGAAFADFRDLDDTCGGLLEMLSADGKYFWVGADEVLGLDFAPPKRLSDLIWRPVRLTLRDGTAGSLYMPMIYAGAGTDGLTDQHRLGRLTDWVDRHGAILGRGQRCFLLGDDAVGAADLTSLRFDETQADVEAA